MGSRYILLHSSNFQLIIDYEHYFVMLVMCIFTLFFMLQIVGSLKILNLSYSVELIKTPDFDGLPSLESLLLKGCLSLTQVCESIGYLERLVLLDISGCRSLKDIPYLPRSLETLKMYGCSNVGVFGQVKCLESCSLSSLLVDIDVSECNLFNNSFPEDWSNLISLKFLNISRNNITSLPGCVKSLPSLKSLDAYECSYLQSVLDVPKSVTDLSTYQNMSLEIVQPTPNPLTLMSAGQCEKLCAVEGCFKLQSIKNVDRKILRYLGLELISEDGMGFEFDKQNAYTEDISIKVLFLILLIFIVSYEFGIFSTYVSGKTLPCFMYKETGSTISFRVPSHPNGSRISGMNMSFMSTSNFGRSIIWEIEVNNKTKDLVWKYTPTIHVTCKEKGEFNYVWLSLWRTNNLLDDGDEIAISIELLGSDVVEECCVNLVYNDDEVGEDNQEEMHEETKDTHCIYNYISWSDRLRVEISDYVHSGKTYCFKIGGAMDVPNMDGISDLIVDWWGLRVGWRCRRIDAGYKESGPAISFKVPSHPNDSRVSGLNVCFSSTCVEYTLFSYVELNNKTKAVVWDYSPTMHPKHKENCKFDYVWLSLWRTGNLLDVGDEISITLLGSHMVDECCVNLVYDDDNDDEVQDDNQEEMYAEKKDAHSMSNQISWIDKLQVDISDYVHSGKTYCFKISGATDVPNINGISGSDPCVI
ncbi:uncharacterized protein LOC143567640 [Bidens hawaiensis]|uniref:uncharacterized protein LOC143567640 n=1 Tax=Bidens hawaiensis TaxID=980011 RepID=UPI00404AAAFE